jgi:hypothetical protein
VYSNDSDNNDNNNNNKRDVMMMKSKAKRGKNAKDMMPTGNGKLVSG